MSLIVNTLLNFGLLMHTFHPLKTRRKANSPRLNHTLNVPSKNLDETLLVRTYRPPLHEAPVTHART